MEDVSDKVPGEVKQGSWIFAQYHPPPIPPGPYTFINLDKNQKVGM